MGHSQGIKVLSKPGRLIQCSAAMVVGESGLCFTVGCSPIYMYIHITDNLA